MSSRWRLLQFRANMTKVRYFGTGLHTNVTCYYVGMGPARHTEYWYAPHTTYRCQTGIVWYVPCHPVRYSMANLEYGP